MKLELKHLAPYLPYQLPMYWEDFNNKQLPVYYLKPEDVLRVLEFQNKPILRPLLDLTKDEYFKLSGESKRKSFPFYYVKANNSVSEGLYFEGYSSKRIPLSNFSNVSYSCFSFLVKNHFDVFGLIEKGLAIDINSIEDVS